MLNLFYSAKLNLLLHSKPLRELSFFYRRENPRCGACTETQISLLVSLSFDVASQLILIPGFKKFGIYGKEEDALHNSFPDLLSVLCYQRQCEKTAGRKLKL